MTAPELVPIGSMTAVLGASHLVKGGPMGTRIVAEVTDVTLVGDRVNATLVSPAAADWLTMGPDRSYGTLDVRVTLRTDDGEIVHVEYSGRIDLTTGKAVSAPLFQTGAEQYDWLNRIQAIGVGQNAPATDDAPGQIVYELFEVRPA
jgi:hypothetical protein